MHLTMIIMILQVAALITIVICLTIQQLTAAIAVTRVTSKLERRQHFC